MSTILDAIGVATPAAERVTALRLLEAVYADPLLLQPTAVQAGVDAVHFQDDHRILWISLDVGQWLPRDDLYQFAKLALKKNNLWCDAEILGNYGAMRWSDATLQALFAAMFPSETAVKHHAEKLIELYELNRTLTECLSRAELLAWPPIRQGPSSDVPTLCRRAPITFVVGAA